MKIARRIIQPTKEGKAVAVENLWREFFLDPSQWWDYRSEKVNPRYPDFKHKKTQEALWLDGKLKPGWVESELAALAPGTLQSDVFTWNTRITKHVADGKYEKALELFHQMHREGTIPDRSTFLRLVKACASLCALEEGRFFHKQIVQAGWESDIYMGSSLIDMYAKCGSLDDARSVFDKMPKRNVVSWNAIIHGYVKNGQGHKALSLYRQMYLEEMLPDCVTFIGILQACGGIGALDQGRDVHEQIIKSGYNSDLSINNSLIDMYAKCGSPESSWQVFQEMPIRSEVSWNAMIQGYVKCGQGLKALELSEQMRQEGVQHDRVTFLGMLNACASVGALKEGRRVHEQIIESNLETDVFVRSGLINMYAKCESLEDARNVFDKMAVRDVASWNAMILGYVRCKRGQIALELCQQMQEEGVKPDPITFAAMLSACAILSALEKGKQVHEQIIKTGDEFELSLGSSLISMYAKCGSMHNARHVFDKMPIRSVRTWNILIQGYANCGQGQKAWDLSQQMQRDGMELDPVTFAGMLNACSSAGFIKHGKRVHAQIIEKGLEGDIFVANSLIDMYAGCGSMADARKVFNKMTNRTIVSWNAMILGHAKCGQAEKVLELYQQMLEEGMKPDPVTFAGVFNACGRKRALEDSKIVHEEMIRSGCEPEGFLGSSLIDMYAKCKSLQDAWEVFNKLHIRSVAAWNAMISGCANYGEEQTAIELFQQMQLQGVNPDSITFLGVLVACGRIRALEEGRHAHEIIANRDPDVYVNNALIDMYAKCGSILEASKVFKKMPARNVYSWNAMILAYAMCGQEQLALKLSEQLQQEVDPVSFFEVPSPCTAAAALEEARCVHEQAVRRVSDLDIFIGSTMSDMHDHRRTTHDTQGALGIISKRTMLS